MLESEFCADVIAALEGAAALTFKVHGHGMQKAGWPDLQVYSSRWTGHIELKVNEPCSRIQQLVMRDLLIRGTPALILRWIGGAVQAENAELGPLGHIPADQWARKPLRSNTLLSLLVLATIELRKTGLLTPWFSQWQVDEQNQAIGIIAHERSPIPTIGRTAAERKRVALEDRRNVVWNKDEG